MWRRASRVLVGAAVAALLLAAPALAQQEARRISLQITVSHASQDAGEVDPGLRDLHRRLQRDFRYRSLHLLQRKRIRLALDEIGEMKLPNGSRVRVRPLTLSGSRLLVATEVQGAVRTDLRMHNHKPVVIVHPEAFRGGRLVISFEPSF